MLEKDPLELLEYIQLAELAEANIYLDIELLRRLAELQRKYSKEDVALLSLTAAAAMFGNETGYLQKQRCTNKECGYSFRSTDISHTCDICYHATMRIVE